MKYHLEDKFVLDGIECKVSFIDRRGFAYLSPLKDGALYHGDHVFQGLIFAILNLKGKDAYNNAAESTLSEDCQAV